MIEVVIEFQLRAESGKDANLVRTSCSIEQCSYMYRLISFICNGNTV